jgi:transposase
MGNPAGVKRDFEALEKRRMHAARLLLRGVPPCEVARQLGVNRMSVYRWERALKDSGAEGLKKTGRAGRKPRLSEVEVERLKGLLLEGPEVFGYATGLWTCPRVADLIRREFGVRFSESHVWWLLRRMGWSPQRPTGRAIERDEEAIVRWKRERWPRLKKTLRRKAKPSSSSTRAG